MTDTIREQITRLGRIAAEAAIRGDEELAARILGETYARIEQHAQADELGDLYTAGMKAAYRDHRKQAR